MNPIVKILLYFGPPVSGDGDGAALDLNGDPLTFNGDPLTF